MFHIFIEKIISHFVFDWKKLRSKSAFWLKTSEVEIGFLRMSIFQHSIYILFWLKTSDVEIYTSFLHFAFSSFETINFDILRFLLSTLNIFVSQFLFLTNAWIRSFFNECVSLFFWGYIYICSQFLFFKECNVGFKGQCALLPLQVQT